MFHNVLLEDHAICRRVRVLEEIWLVPQTQIKPSPGLNSIFNVGSLYKSHFNPGLISVWETVPKF